MLHTCVVYQVAHLEIVGPVNYKVAAVDEKFDVRVVDVGNVFFDVSLTIPHVFRAADAYRSFGLLIATAVLAGAFPALRAASLPIATTLRAEAVS